MQETPRASIIVPVLNAGSCLAASLRSLLVQTENAIEIIIVDNGSTDCSREIMSNHADRDERIRIVECPERGLSRARNAGVAAARSPFVIFQDADDESAPRRVETLCDFLDERSGVAGVSSWYEMRDEKLRRRISVEATPITPDMIRFLLPFATTFPASFCALRREVLLSVGGFAVGLEFPGPPEDHDLAIRLVAGGHQLANIAEFLYRVRIHGESLTGRTGGSALRDAREATCRRILGYSNASEICERYLAPRLEGVAPILWGSWGRTMLSRWIRASAALGRPGFFSLSGLGMKCGPHAWRMENSAADWGRRICSGSPLVTGANVHRAFDNRQRAGMFRQRAGPSWISEEEAIRMAKNKERTIVIISPQDRTRALECCLGAGLAEGEEFIDLASFVEYSARVLS